MLNQSHNHLFTLTHPQKRIWYVEQMYPGTPLHNLAGTATYPCALDFTKLQEAFNEFVRLHDATRIRIVESPVAEARQYVSRFEPFDVRLTDFSSEKSPEQAFQGWIGQQCRRPFKLDGEPLFRVEFFRVSPEQTGYFVNCHHIISDGWSFQILAAFVSEAYRHQRPAEQPPYSYIRASEELGYKRVQRFEESRLFWLNQLRGCTRYPADATGTAGEQLRFRLPREGAVQVRSYTAASRISTGTVFTALLLAYLAKRERAGDLVIGLPVLNRSGIAKRAFGMFTSTMPLRMQVNQSETFGSFVQRVANALLQCFRHQRYPYDLLLRDLAADGNSEDQLFRACMNVYNTAPAEAARIGAETVTVEEHYPGHQLFPLYVIVKEWPADESIDIVCNYKPALYSRDGVKQLAEFLMHAAALVPKVLDTPLRELVSNVASAEPRSAAVVGNVMTVNGAARSTTAAPLNAIGEAEEALLLHRFNDTKAEFPQDTTITTLFEETSARFPDSLALRTAAGSWTYARLNERANQFAHFLREKGVGPGSIVPIMVERSAELLVSILGVLKAGAAYLPIDPAYPQSRIDFILNDSETPLAVSNSGLFARTAKRLLVNVDDPVSYSSLTSNPSAAAGPRDLAYVCYTSGSTGQPKGAMIEHRSLVNRIHWMQRAYPLSCADVLIQKTSISFDVSVWELFWWATAGASLCLANPGDEKSPERLVECIQKHGVTVVHFVPSMLQAFLSYLRQDGNAALLPSLRHVFASGEALRPEHVDAFYSVFAGRATRLTNLYGPTEATVDVTYHDCSPADVRSGVPIGRPIDNTWLRILSPDLKLQPVGVPGELYIGGVGVARGYWNRPELNSERFIADPYEPYARLYRTGDIARWLANGEVEFLGRNDDQVKVRGYRVELGEIETALREHASVADAIVIARPPAQASQQLCAYVTLKTACTMDELREHLASRIPTYMVPAWLQILDAIPLSPNGKVDRAALPAPVVVNGRVCAESTEQRALVEIWRDVLEIPAVGIDDNFFALGGDSIKIISLIVRARSHGYLLATQDVYQRPTIRKLAEVLRPQARSRSRAACQPFALLGPEDRSSLPETAEDAYPLSALQIGLIYQSHIIRATPFYHDVFSYRIKGVFDADRFGEAVVVLCRNHSIFRTTFHLDGFSEPMQIVHREAPAPLRVADLRRMPADAQELAMQRDIAGIRTRPFDWKTPNLVGFHIHLLSESEYLYTIDFHDSALDGWSVNVIHRELFETYYGLLSGRPAQPDAPGTPFSEFIALEQAALASPEHKQFWAKTLADSNFITLPRWPHREPVQHSGISFHDVHLPAGLSEAVKQAANLLGVPLKTVLLAAHVYVLSLLGGERHITTGYEYGVRPEGTDGERSIGLFLNTVPIRVDAQTGSWQELIERVYRAEVDFIPYRRYPMSQMKRDSGVRGPLFEHVFNFTHFHVLSALKRIAGFDLLEVNVRAETEFVFRAECSVHPFTGEVLMWIHYHADVFPAEQIEHIGGYYVRALQALTRDPAAAPAHDAVLGEEERRRQLYEFNCNSRDLPAAACAHQLFEEQAARSPGAVAAVCGAQRWTYAELNRAANKLAEALLQTAGSKLTVAVATTRNAGWIAAVLACFKSGNAYLPVDIDQPSARICDIISRAQCRIAIADDARLGRKLAEAAGASNAGEMQVLVADEILRGNSDASNPSLAVCPDDLAYIIFTSGSTGSPKGAMIEHGGMLNHLLAKIHDLQLTPADVVVQNASQCFDISLWQFLAPLLAGARVVMLPKPAVDDVGKFVSTLRSERVSILEVVPSYLNVVLQFLKQSPQALPLLRYLLVTGEPVKPELLERWFDAYPKIPVVNAYGPTEASDDICHHFMRAAPKSALTPVGKPIQNLSVYVLDERLHLLPIGASGEVCVSGIGVGRGYMNDAARTSSAFVQDPFRPSQRMYRTGDIGRWLPDGVLELVGRRDDQVKIRGYRIEIGEIESRIQQCPGIRDAAVIVDPRNTALAAFVVAETAFDTGELRHWVSQQLPEYMVPAHFVSIDKLPLSSNGKVAKQQLSARLELDERRASIAPPVSATESQLRRLWADVLKLDADRIGRDSDFFDMGGHSLKAMELSLRAEGRFSINDVIKYPVLRDLAARVEQLEASPAISELLVDYSDEGIVPTMSIVGFTYAAGHAANFKPMFDALKQRRRNLGCYAIDLTRHSQSAMDLDRIARLCVEQIRTTVRGPIILWGHCSGTALALEVARLLEAAQHDLRLVILGGKVIRSRSASKIRGLAARAVSPFVAVSAARMSSAQIQEWLIAKTGFDGFGGLGENEARFLTHAFRHEAIMAGEYLERAYDSHGALLKAPILNVVAQDDLLTKGYCKKYVNWRLFSRHVELSVLESGGHYFIKTRPEESANLILSRAQDLDSSLAARV